MAVAVWQVQPTQLATAQVETMEEIRLEEKEPIINLVGINFSQVCNTNCGDHQEYEDDQ